MTRFSNAFVFAVVGESHVARLNIALRYLRNFSKLPIIVVQARSRLRANNDLVVDVELPDQWSDHRAAIMLKINVHRYVEHIADRICYLDGDVVAVSDDVDLIFDEPFDGLRFAKDHVDIDTFSRWAVNCGCAESRCGHLRDALLTSFGITIPDGSSSIWNGGVFLLERGAEAAMEMWSDMTLQAFDDPFWRDRDQGTLIAALHKTSRASAPPLPEAYNYIADFLWGMTIEERPLARPADYHVRNDFSLEHHRPGGKLKLIHFINGGIDRPGWRPWDEVAGLIGA